MGRQRKVLTGRHSKVFLAKAPFPPPSPKAPRNSSIQLECVRLVAQKGAGRMDCWSRLPHKARVGGRENVTVCDWLGGSSSSILTVTIVYGSK
jgi:hypothetical protein